ncbi:hypothetical protein C1H46_019622 [Malus baccata]|uniref:Uncharacterized protein n=1 Tax=Malus baccata TaxID=106549 RepID=A0A540M7W0_MALBA|nr:hypothetical protein C1H46_019622 [Malus baccata]
MGHDSGYVLELDPKTQSVHDFSVHVFGFCSAQSQRLIFSSNPGPNGSLFPHFKTAFSDRQGRLQICTRVVQPDGEFPRMLIEKLKHPSFASPILHIRTLSLICLSPFAL